MPSHKLLLLAGDGIGPEVMAEVKRLLEFLSKSRIASFEIEAFRQFTHGEPVAQEPLAIVPPPAKVSSM